jgi:hypothetical protein
MSSSSNTSNISILSSIEDVEESPDFYDNNEEIIDYEEEVHNLTYNIVNSFKYYIHDNCLPLLENLEYSDFLQYIDELLIKY